MGIQVEAAVEALGDQAAKIKAEAWAGDEVVVLGETLEYPFAFVDRDSASGVRNTDTHRLSVIFSLVGERDTSLFRELIGIVQQMGDDDTEMARVRIDKIVMFVSFNPVIDIRFLL